MSIVPQPLTARQLRNSVITGSRWAARRAEDCGGRRRPAEAGYEGVSLPIDFLVVDRDTALPYNCHMVFIETTTFTKLVYEYLSEEEFAGLQNYLLNRPNAGDVIPGSGGVRKLRWGIERKGKRGGIRVIYYRRVSEGEIWLITLYAKNEISTISPQILKKIAEEIKHG